MGFRKDGRITAHRPVHRQDNGPYDAMGDARSAGQRRVADLPAGSDALARRQRPDQHAAAHAAARRRAAMQGIGIVEPIITKAAKQLGLDQVAIRRINAPDGKAPFGPPLPNGSARRT